MVVVVVVMVNFHTNFTISPIHHFILLFSGGHIGTFAFSFVYDTMYLQAFIAHVYVCISVYVMITSKRLLIATSLLLLPPYRSTSYGGHLSPPISYQLPKGDLSIVEMDTLLMCVCVSYHTSSIRMVTDKFLLFHFSL